MSLRGVATITVYVYGETKDDLLEQAEKMKAKLNDEYDCNCDIEEIGIKNFAENYEKFNV